MNDADNTQDRGLTTEQIANASSGPTWEDTQAPGGDGYDDDAGSLGTDLTAPGHADRDMPDGGAAADTRPHASLLDEGELQSITMRWKDIQAEFVDEPQPRSRKRTRS